MLGIRYGECTNCGHSHTKSKGRIINGNHREFWRLKREEDYPERECPCGCKEELTLVLDVRRIEKEKKGWSLINV